ncbi:hypothetical protein [Streptomyces sp. NPDC001100]
MIKLGAEGAFALLDGRPHRQPALPARVYDSVGAGDARTRSSRINWT